MIAKRNIWVWVVYRLWLMASRELLQMAALIWEMHAALD